MPFADQSSCCQNEDMSCRSPKLLVVRSDWGQVFFGSPDGQKKPVLITHGWTTRVKRKRKAAQVCASLKSRRAGVPFIPAGMVWIEILQRSSSDR